MIYERERDASNVCFLDYLMTRRSIEQSRSDRGEHTLWADDRRLRSGLDSVPQSVWS